MNNFYSANGQFRKIDIIEHLDITPPTGISIISYMIENENMKNRISVLESEIGKLEDKIKKSQVLYLPFNNNKTSRIISKNSNNWSSMDDNIVLELIYDNELDYIPQVYVELSEKNMSDLVYKTTVYDINEKSFKCKLLVENLDLNNYKDGDGNNIYSDNLDFIRKNVSLNYMIIE